MKVLDYNGLSYFWNKLKEIIVGKQDLLVSGTNIKTIDSQSVLGQGDIQLNSVKYTTQTLTDQQQAQARTNISAASDEDLELTDAQVANLGGIVSEMESRMSSVLTPRYAIAWDGVSSPDSSKIPDVCVVSYGGNNYHGLLEADGTNANLICLVGENGGASYLRYLSGLTSTGYEWIPLGSTTVDMSDYIRKDSVVWLTEEQFDNLLVKDPNVTYNVYEETAAV